MEIIKRLIIFCEGYNEIEKTTIIQRLANELQLPLLKLKNPRSCFRKGMGSHEEFMYVFSHVLFQLRHTSYIVDGSPLSSLVKCNIYKRKAALNYIYPLLLKIDPLVIFFTLSKKSLLFSTKTKQPILLSEKLKILEGFEEYFSTQQLISVFKVDVATNTPTRIINKILKYLENKKYIKI